MKYYLVTLTLILGECEKKAHHAIHVPDGYTEESVGELALSRECHVSCTPEDGGVWDDGWFYKVHSIKELSEEDYNTYNRICH